MRKWIITGVLLVALFIVFYPFCNVLSFTETKTDEPKQYIFSLKQQSMFQLIFTHSIHLTDVIETYEALETNELRLVSMEYEDVAIGMPAYAEEGQTLIYEDGKYKLSYEQAVLPNFTLYIGDVDYELSLVHQREKIDLKKRLQRGKSYLIEVHTISLFHLWIGDELND